MTFCENVFATSLTDALQETRIACSGIEKNLQHLKTMAGINTAVTGVGTVTGAIAVGSGIAKNSVDNTLTTLEYLIIERSDIPIETLEIEDMQSFYDDIDKVLSETEAETYHELEQKSKTLGDIRTGTLAVSTATNVVGTAIASTNQVDEDFEEKINKCVLSIKNLSTVKTKTQFEQYSNNDEILEAEYIIKACRDYEYIDLSSINKHATGAAVSSGIGIGTGLTGAILSGIANTKEIRHGDENKEKKLNTTSNVMSGVTTVASAAATVFNAVQISTIKKVLSVAEKCEEVLK